MIPLAPRDAPIPQFLPLRVAHLALIRAIRREGKATCWRAYAIHVASRAACLGRCLGRCLGPVYEHHG